MKKSLPAFAALLVLGASWSAPTSAASPIRGSTVLVPPLFSKAPFVSARTRTVVIRLPVQAGKVSKMVTTNLVSKSESWIAKGDKYYSLCMPNRRKVACAPIVATSIMQDIEIGAHAGDKGVPMITFHINPATKQPLKRLLASINYFMLRTHKQVAHYNRMAMNYAPLKGLTPLKPGNFAAALIAETGSSGCVYDDFGDLDCTGGDSGTNGGGADPHTYDWTDEEGADNPAPSATPPTFPSGNDNGNTDPCIDGSGNNTCQQVTITGQRQDSPDLMAYQTCVITPMAFACRATPPVISDPFEPPMPSRPRPLLPQSACNFAPIFCSAGQVPEIPPPPLTDWEKLQARKAECYKKVDAEMVYCRAIQGKYEDPNNHCMRNAVENLILCDKMGKDGY